MDANIDFLKWNTDNLPAGIQGLVTDLFSRIFPLGVTQEVTTPTGLWPGQSSSGLDHLYTDNPRKLSKVHTELRGSDHKLIKVTRYARSITMGSRYIRKRCYKDFDETEFREKISQISWLELYLCNDEEAVQILTSNLNRVLDQLAPVKTVQMRSKYAPWLSSETKVIMKERDAAQVQASDSNHPDDWRLFRNLRNHVTRRMRNEKASWERQRLDHSQNSSTNLWKNIKGWLNWKASGPPTQLYFEGSLINTPKGMATTMNRFFITKVNKLRQGIAASNADPLEMLRQTMSRRTCSFNLRPAHPDEILKKITNLKNSKSTGLDYIEFLFVFVFSCKAAALHSINSLTHSQSLKTLD